MKNINKDETFYLIENKYWNINKDYNCDKLLYLLIDRPDQISRYNDFIWLNNKNQHHRDYDLPASSWYDGEIIWYKDDKFNRENDKPALINENGTKEYYIDGIFIKSEK